MPVTYPFDPTGLAPSNIIPDEIHTLTEVNARTHRILIPNCSPFYLGSLQLKHVDSSGQTRLLVEDIDYTLCLPYIGATRSIGQMIYGGITIHQSLINGLIKITYRTLGGDWIADGNYVLEMLAEYVYNPRITVWDTVTNRTDAFPPINHDQSMDYVYGHQDLITSINELADTIITHPNPTTGIISHLIDVTNPHETTKDQVGLGLVENYPIASDAEVDSLAQVDKYFTLRQLTLLGIIGLDANLLGVHIGDHQNPHQVNALQIGLGQVADLPLALDTDVVAGIPTEAYVTLRQVLDIVTNMAPVVLQGSDISRAEILFTSSSTSRRIG